MRSKNRSAKTTLAVAAAMSVLLMLASGASSALANITSNSSPASSSPIPQFLQLWERANPDYSGCLTGSVQQQTVEEVPCQTNLAPVGLPVTPTPTPVTGVKQSVNPLYSYGPSVIDCSGNCWAGGVFYYNGPYAGLYGYVIIPYPPSSTPGKFMGWIGLSNGDQNGCPASGSGPCVLVQSGFTYGTLYNGTSPDMFVELYGSFYWNGNYCESVFCGYRIQVNADAYLYNAEFYNSNGWTAYVQDNTQSTYTLVTDSGSNVGVTGSLPYAIPSMEAYGASSNSYINTPIYFTSLAVYYPLGTQVNIDSSNMLSYLYPTASSGVTVSYSATGSTTGAATVT